MKNVFIKETPLSCFTLSPPHEDIRKGPFITQKRVLTRTRPCWHHDLRLPAPRTVKNTFLLFISLNYGILLRQLNGLRHRLELETLGKKDGGSGGGGGGGGIKPDMKLDHLFQPPW